MSYLERTKLRMKANMPRMAEWKYEMSWGPWWHPWDANPKQLLPPFLLEGDDGSPTPSFRPLSLENPKWSTRISRTSISIAGKKPLEFWAREARSLRYEVSWKHQLSQKHLSGILQKGSTGVQMCHLPKPVPKSQYVASITICHNFGHSHSILFSSAVTWISPAWFQPT